MNDISGTNWRVMFGSCLDRLKDLEDESVDSVVTDPPYELGFMGKSWDSSGIAYNVEVWRECLRVLKPGGHVLAFGGSRTWHRLAVAVEDAGFEIRDSIAWIYGSGFPKSLDVSKAIDKAAGAEREVVGEKITGGIKRARPDDAEGFSNPYTTGQTTVEVTAPATPEAQKWEGWGTALKPAHEPVVVGRKPLTGTVAANVLEWGVGGLNIDGTRIGTDGGGTNCDKRDNLGNCLGHDGSGKFSNTVHAKESTVSIGRWPSNVMLDEFTAALVDEQSGLLKGKIGMTGKTGTNNSVYGHYAQNFYRSEGVADTGGASRFFYVAKASKRDRNEGLDALPEVLAPKGNYEGRDINNQKNVMGGGSAFPKARNFHPTVKPTDLMRQLVRLITPSGGLVLDPFTGSGSTGKAAILEGFQFVGVELTEEYLPIIEGRLNHAVQLKADLDAKNEEALF